MRWIHRAALAVVAVSTLTLSARAEAGPVVHVRGPVVVTRSIAPPMPAPVVLPMRPPSPSPAHVWVDGSWQWNGIAWAWQPGYWVVQASPPPRVHVHAAPRWPPVRPVPARPVRPTPSRVVLVSR